MKRLILIALTGLFAIPLTAQTESFTERFYESYEDYREPSIAERRIKHADIQPLIDALADKPGIEVRRVGASIEGRPLRLISLGRGETDVFLWSQMHGDEPTATQAIFDILNFFAAPEYASEKTRLLDSLRLHFLPMLNPDGAEVFQRRNTLGIDINRDALRLQSPEGQALKRVRDSLEAEFGFNLHDQSTYYNAERTPKPATISYLAPAYNYEKDINEVRSRAMQVIGYMNRIIQRYAPGQVGKYNDDFEPRAFGDNIQKWGTSAILIESGGYSNDPEKQEIRKLNYVSILSAIYAIGSGSYREMGLDTYEGIPENDRKLFDLKLERVTYPLLGEDYIIDLGIHRFEVDTPDHSDFWYSSRIADQGDLSTFYGYETLDGSGYRLQAGKVYDQVLPDMKAVAKLDFWSLLEKGITYVRVTGLPQKTPSTPFPVHLVAPSFKAPEARWEVGDNPTFALTREGAVKYVVVNGFLYKPGSREGSGKNSMILR
ncbi:M14 family zinc carboxypeptidase [Robiginitalea sp. SC105]|uniref:M14 family zinc carboxypeptidase n=1 Tax=Robiginitalea sp. SC105 TaxID=2762332 RepID=UPI001639ADFC|nr:M14 family zinc carboxypeptidase [Robiginitalea sp. SC105]MBC2840570.1 peptidase M14 [Robiginitalea sp. SC105]